MPNTEQQVQEKANFGALYKRFRGGPQSDKRLYADSLPILAPRLSRSASVLDIGCGHGGFTKLMFEQNPAQLLVTDYEREHVDRVLKRLASIESTTALSGERLDVTSELSTLKAILGDKQFTAIALLSVLMHMRPDLSALVIQNLSTFIAPGGAMLVGVIDREVAEKFYIPAPSKGEDVFYPAMTGFEPNAIEADVDADAMDLTRLSEFYPPNAHYEAACQSTGHKVTALDSIAGEECLKPTKNGGPCVYAPLVDAKLPLWKLWLVENV